eukprot:1255415-Pleurochrysis_carterae.AAC.1
MRAREPYMEHVPEMKLSRTQHTRYCAAKAQGPRYQGERHLEEDEQCVKEQNDYIEQWSFIE